MFFFSFLLLTVTALNADTTLNVDFDFKSLECTSPTDVITKFGEGKCNIVEFDGKYNTKERHANGCSFDFCYSSLLQTCFIGIVSFFSYLKHLNKFFFLMYINYILNIF